MTKKYLGRGPDYLRTLRQFQKVEPDAPLPQGDLKAQATRDQFSDHEKAIAYLLRLRQLEKHTCPRCRKGPVLLLKTNVIRCAKCRDTGLYDETPFAGKKWKPGDILHALWLLLFEESELTLQYLKKAIRKQETREVDCLIEIVAKTMGEMLPSKIAAKTVHVTILPWSKIAGARGKRAETATGAVGLAAVIKSGGIGVVIATQLKNDDPAEMVSWLKSLPNDTPWSTVFHVTWKTIEFTYAKDGINICSSVAGNTLHIEKVVASLENWLHRTRRGQFWARHRAACITQFAFRYNFYNREEPPPAKRRRKLGPDGKYKLVRVSNAKVSVSPRHPAAEYFDSIASKLFPAFPTESGEPSTAGLTTAGRRPAGQVKVIEAAKP